MLSRIDDCGRRGAFYAPQGIEQCLLAFPFGLRVARVLVRTDRDTLDRSAGNHGLELGIIHGNGVRAAGGKKAVRSHEGDDKKDEYPERTPEVLSHPVEDVVLVDAWFFLFPFLVVTSGGLVQVRRIFFLEKRVFVHQW